MFRQQAKPRAGVAESASDDELISVTDACLCIHRTLLLSRTAMLVQRLVYFFRRASLLT